MVAGQKPHVFSTSSTESAHRPMTERSRAAKPNGAHMLVPGLDPHAAYVSRLSARSALYTDLHQLLEGHYCPLAQDKYRARVVDENCLAKPSKAAREKTWKELKLS